MVKKKFIQFILPKYSNLFCSACENTIETGFKQGCELKLIRNDGKNFWAQIEIIFQYEDQFKMTIIDIDERKEVERALLENERKFRISLETLLDAFAIFSAVRKNNVIIDFKFEYINEVGCKLNQKTYGEQVGYNLLEIFPDHETSGLFQEYVEVVETGNPLVKESLIYEYKFGKRKLLKTYDIRAVKLGEGFALTWRDVTERKKAEKRIKRSLEEKEILLREIHHRIKNNMQVISSLLGLQSLYVKDKNSINILKESQERVKSMAMVHEKLYGSKDFSKINLKEYAKDLSTHLFNSFGVQDIELKVAGEDLFLGLDTAIPCGLIINELVTNSIKYAFPRVENGKSANNLSMSVNVKHEYVNETFESSKSLKNESSCLKNEICINLGSNGDELIIIISDNGIGIPEGKILKNSGTLGFLIVNTLVNQIKGVIKITNKYGTEFKIKFPNPK